MAGATVENVKKLVATAAQYAQNPRDKFKDMADALASATGESPMTMRENLAFAESISKGRTAIKGKPLDPVVGAIMQITGTDEQETGKLLRDAKTGKAPALQALVNSLNATPDPMAVSTALDSDKNPTKAPSILTAQGTPQITVTPREIEVAGGKPIPIKTVQRMLVDAGHPLPEHGVDGFDGKEFRQALNTFRLSHLEGRNVGDPKIHPDEVEALKKLKIVADKGEEMGFDDKKSAKPLADMRGAKQAADALKGSLGEGVHVTSSKSQPMNVEQQAAEFPSRGRR